MNIFKKIRLAALVIALTAGMISRLVQAEVPPTLTQKHVLLLYSNVLGLPAHRKNSDAFLAVMEKAGVPLTNIHYEFLDLVRNSSTSYRQKLSEFLQQKYAGIQMDVIITIDGAAQSFILQEGQNLSPKAPVISVLSPKELNEPVSRPHMIQILAKADFEGTLQQALRLFPESKSIYFVVGASEDEKQWITEARKAFASWSNQLKFEFTNTYTHAKMLQGAADLPKDALLFYSSFYQDGAGQPFVPRVVAAQVLAATQRPVFGTYDGLMGAGVMGGSMFSYETEGERAGQLAINLMTQKMLLTKPLTTLPSLNKLILDWAQLQRWKINETQFSENTTFINRPPTLWQQYKQHVIIAVVIGILQTFLIAALLLQRHLRQLVEKTLRESEERFRVLVEQAPDAICLFDVEQNRFIDVNKKAEQLFACSREELLKANPQQFYPPEQPDSLPVEQSFRTYLKEALEGKIAQFERKIRNGQGAEVFAEVRLSKLPSLHGPWIRASFLDITQRRRAEEELRCLSERLRQSEKMDAIGQLAGGIAHDFNNQLGAIMGYAELLASSMEDTNLRRFAENILKATQRSADLTRNLLAFSRKGKYLTVPVNLHTVINEVVALLQHSIDKRITIRQDFHAKIALTLGDPTQLQNALLNLAINARDAMPNGGELIFTTSTCELAAKAEGLDITAGQYLQVNITDTGTGMSPEVQKRLYEPFFTTKEVGKGTGLGLAAVYGMIKNHGGAIAVYSEVGHGTTFKLYLPLQETEIAELPKPTIVTPKHCNAQILIIDDEDSVRSVLTEMLQNLGYKVIAFDNGEEAIIHYQNVWKQIDLVIFDMIMTKIGGRETFLAMQKINPKIRAILASGFSLNGEAQAILNDGALGFLQKPFQIGELSQKIDAALAHTSKLSKDDE